MTEIPPLVILTVGVATVIGMILVLRLNAFLALVTAAVIVSLMSPLGSGQSGGKIGRVADAFGEAAGEVGIVIALAAIIGECMMVSGAADAIVQFFIRLLGEKRAAWALMFTAFVLAIPVFFDTVFYLLVPLARSLYRKTGRNYLLSVMAICCGGTVTHTLVPPTPGPLAVAEMLGVDVGKMILVGATVALPPAILGMFLCGYLDRKLNVPFRELPGADAGATVPTRAPSLGLSLLPVLLPVVLIASDTIVTTFTTPADQLSAGAVKTQWDRLAPVTALFGNPNLAMLLATASALFLLRRTTTMTLRQMSGIVERALMSGGVIILIVSGGGAFGGALKGANIGPAIRGMFESVTGDVNGMMYLFLGYAIAALLKFALGSSTVSMITSAGMIGAMLAGPDAGASAMSASATAVMLGYHPVYLATAIGAGSLMASWMNDAGFWIYSRMGGLTEIESLKTWTVLLAFLSLISMAVTVLLAMMLPMV